MFGILLTDTQAKYYEYRKETEAQLSEKDVKIEQLEKEVRLLRTDLNLKENGFSEK
jgi:cell shape-determining protein MreC